MQPLTLYKNSGRDTLGRVPTLLIPMLLNGETSNKQVTHEQRYSSFIQLLSSAL